MNRAQVLQVLAFVGILGLNNFIYAQSQQERKYLYSLGIGLNSGYQQRTSDFTPSIQQRITFRLNFGASIQVKLPNCFFEIYPNVGFATNGTKSVKTINGQKAKYLFGADEQRFLVSLLWGKNLSISSEKTLSLSTGISTGYGTFNPISFEDDDYKNNETQLNHFLFCISTKVKIPILNRCEIGLQWNEGVMNYSKAEIHLEDKRASFISKASSANLSFYYHF